MQVFMREVSKVAHAKILTMPSVTMSLKEPAQIGMVADKEVKRIGPTITYCLESIDGVLKLDGNFKHGGMNDGSKAGDGVIDTQEMIFRRACELDKPILVSKGDTHLFITLTKCKE